MTALINQELAKIEKRNRAYGRSVDPAMDAFSEAWKMGQEAKTRSKNNAVETGVNMLPQLAGLIRDENSLANFEKMSGELAEKANRHSETAPYSQFISRVAGNIREDYNTYSTEMERGAKIIDASNFLDTQEEFVNLGKSIKGMTLEDGKTPQYEGTLDYLVKENDKLNSIIGRIETASKGTQFRYNKNSKYTDREIGEKLSSYQKRISVAVQTAIGNGEITPEEAEFIMLGDVKTYKEKKKEKVKTLNYQYKSMDNAHRKIADQIRALQSKEFKNADKAVLQIFAKTFSQDLQSDLDADPTLDAELDAISPEQMIEDLNEKNKQIAIAKSRTMSSYEAWEGMPMFDAPKSTKSETGNLLQNIMIDDGKGSINNPLSQTTQGQPKDWTQEELQDVMNTWAALPKEEAKKYSDWMDYGTKVHGIIFQRKKSSEEKEKKVPKLTYDPAMGDTTVARNRARIKKYKISPQQLGDLEDQWSEENSGETFDSWLDKAFTPAPLDEDIEKMWKSLSKEDKAKYRSLANFKKNWK